MWIWTYGNVSTETLGAVLCLQLVIAQPVCFKDVLTATQRVKFELKPINLEMTTAALKESHKGIILCGTLLLHHVKIHCCVCFFFLYTLSCQYLASILPFLHRPHPDGPTAEAKIRLLTSLSLEKMQPKSSHY